jgi:hypothetical protein
MENIIVKDIDFFDINLNFDISESMNTEDIITELSKDFKQELTKICNENNIKFMRNENDDLFIPLRKYYASAIRLKLSSDNPENDKKYIILKENIGLGMEKVYYTYSVIPKLINDVYKEFIIDSKHPLLYNFQDGDNNYAFDDAMSSRSEFNFIRWQSRIEEAKNPGHMDWLMKSSKRTDKIEEKFSELFANTWLDNYNERLGIIFNRLALDLIKNNNESMNRITNSLKNI